MLWDTIGHIADILGIASFILSLGIIRQLYARAEFQKETYKAESGALLEHLIALQKIFGKMVLIHLKFRIHCK